MQPGADVELDRSCSRPNVAALAHICQRALAAGVHEMILQRWEYGPDSGVVCEPDTCFRSPENAGTAGS
jgi:hypothetical protein